MGSVGDSNTTERPCANESKSDLLLKKTGSEIKPNADKKQRKIAQRSRNAILLLLLSCCCLLGDNNMDPCNKKSTKTAWDPKTAWDRLAAQIQRANEDKSQRKILVQWTKMGFARVLLLGVFVDLLQLFEQKGNGTHSLYSIRKLVFLPIDCNLKSNHSSMSLSTRKRMALDPRYATSHQVRRHNV